MLSTKSLPFRSIPKRPLTDQLISHSVNQGDTVIGMVERPLHPVEVAVFLHQLHGVDFAHGVRPDVSRNPIRPRRPLYVLPNRLSRPVLPIIPRRRKRPKPRPAMRGLVYVPPLSLRHIWLSSPANLINQRTRQPNVPPLPGLSLCNPHLFTKRKRQAQSVPYP